MRATNFNRRNPRPAPPFSTAVNTRSKKTLVLSPLTASDHLVSATAAVMNFR
jgi:hypothetical protein